ncbi:MAG: hypothetical protein II885_10060 [Oscillospiraceae bacterium]|nr:hypothetical protein [Oscillospiraceae bacterium]
MLHVLLLYGRKNMLDFMEQARKQLLAGKRYAIIALACCPAPERRITGKLKN